MNKQLAQEWVMPGRDLSVWNAPGATEAHAPAPKGQAVAHKQIVTIRLDADMLDWFKGAGPGYQTRINQILRQHMADQGVEGARQPN
ncbi:MAG: BrnA antitoxin family protein [Massilia sp.]|nr:BrnA antitoxin family protein [Massilia sp.]